MTDNNKEYYEVANKLLADIAQIHRQIETISSTIPAADRVQGAMSMISGIKMVLAPTKKTVSALEDFVLSRK